MPPKLLSSCLSVRRICWRLPKGYLYKKQFGMRKKKPKQLSYKCSTVSCFYTCQQSQLHRLFKKRKKVFNHPRRSLAEPFSVNFNSFQLGLKRFLNQLDHWCKYKCDSCNEYSFRNWNLPTRQNKLNETQQLGLTKQFSRTQGLIHIFFIFIETEVIYSDELSVLKS